MYCFLFSGLFDNKKKNTQNNSDVSGIYIIKIFPRLTYIKDVHLWLIDWIVYCIVLLSLSLSFFLAMCPSSLSSDIFVFDIIQIKTTRKNIELSVNALYANHFMLYRWKISILIWSIGFLLLLLLLAALSVLVLIGKFCFPMILNFLFDLPVCLFFDL